MLTKVENNWTLAEAAHLLNRAGFGGSPAEIKALHAKGRIEAVNFLITSKDGPDAFPLPNWATRAQAIADAQARVVQRREIMEATRDMTPEKAEQTRREAFRKVQQLGRQQTQDGQGWWFHRLAHTQAPLREKMTLFWHDHFATSIQKVRQPALMMLQNEMFRSMAMGNFKELTQAILLDPAMLLYLDTENSRKGKPNENFAREVMELFTLGEGNYTEEDIRQAARAFTGYQINRMNGSVVHNRRQWDGTPKTIFGKTGPFDGKDVINLIFEKPGVATFLAKKIWEYFVYGDPPDKAVEALGRILRDANYEVEPLLREIFLAKEFYSEKAVRTQIKSPVQFTVQILKQLEIGSAPGGFAARAQQELGQVLFMPPNVAGWDWGQGWINTNTLLTRYNLAGFITKGAEDVRFAGGKGGKGGKGEKPRGMGGAFKNRGRGWDGPDYDKIAPPALRGKPEELVDALIFRFFQGPVPDKARGLFIEYANTKKDESFTGKEIAELCHLMLSTPYYQLC